MKVRGKRFIHWTQRHTANFGFCFSVRGKSINKAIQRSCCCLQVSDARMRGFSLRRLLHCNPHCKRFELKTIRGGRWFRLPQQAPVGLLCAQNSLKERFVHVHLHTMSCTMCQWISLVFIARKLWVLQIFSLNLLSVSRPIWHERSSRRISQSSRTIRMFFVPSLIAVS